MKLHFTLLKLAMLLFFPTAIMAQWAPKVNPIKTQWTDLVDKKCPLPEYPRPQFVRNQWSNLNGVWKYKSGTKAEALPNSSAFTDTILVPFPIESTLSGVIKHFDRLWYRRTFTINDSWKTDKKRIILHFGAIDWESEVYINGKSMGIHKGGYDAFSYDITDSITASGQQELIVRVFDPTRDYGQPRGKQTTAPSGAMYTCVTGIWQTVWLESVPERSIGSLKLTPDIDNKLLKVTVNIPDSAGLTVTVTAKDGASDVAVVSNKLNTEFSIPIPAEKLKLWSPESPFLYDLKIELKKGTAVIDTVSSYFGMRKISRNVVGSVNKLYLNNKFVFQMGPLDQGFWPDGIYTAPTDEALKYDIEITKALGFNMTRKHIKVEPQRWYYWADKLGIMVWQDMPSANSYDTPAGVTTDELQHETEMTRMINNHINSPSIIMWVLFNEGCGQFDTKGRIDLAYKLDPSRLVDQGSGGGVANPSAGDVIDAHRYPQPLCETQPNQASVSGEYGGVFYKVVGQQWGTPDVLPEHAQTATDLVNMYSGLADQVIWYKTKNNLCAAIYTQITDVETEINGLITYNRKLKADVNLFKTINERIINQNVVTVVDVLPNSGKVPQTWKYTTTKPVDTWNTPTFIDTKWISAPGGFGSPKPAGGTLWNTPDIWLRMQFTVTDVNKDEVAKLALYLIHDENCEVYINGSMATSLYGYTSAYEASFIDRLGRKALILNGKNTIAVHCLQKTGGQFIDVGIVKLILSEDTTLAYSPKPTVAQTDIDTTYKLSWRSGRFSTSHKVYFGTNANLTETELISTQKDTTLVIKELKRNTTYYWRVDEVNTNGVKTGYVWRFTTKSPIGLINSSMSQPSIFPNPIVNGEQLTVDFGENAEKYEKIGFWSVDGSKLFDEQINGDKTISIDLAAHKLASGVYLVRAENNGRFSEPMKLIISK